MFKLRLDDAELDPVAVDDKDFVPVDEDVGVLGGCVCEGVLLADARARTTLRILQLENYIFVKKNIIRGGGGCIFFSVLPVFSESKQGSSKLTTRANVPAGSIARPTPNEGPKPAAVPTPSTSFAAPPAMIDTTPDDISTRRRYWDTLGPSL